MTAPAPLIVFAPFVSQTMRIEPAWIDFNGHLNMAYYLVLFDRAIDEAMALAGLGPDYVERRACSYFTAETHTLYLRELRLGEPVRATVQLIDHDEKRIHVYLELRHAAEGWVAASCEQLFLHVDMTDRKVRPFPDDVLAGLAAMKSAHRRLPKPRSLGRAVRLKGKAAASAPEDADAGASRTDSTRH